MKKAIYTSEQTIVIEKIIEARKEAGMTQKQLAEKLGWTQSFISKIEAGQRRIDVILLRQLAIILNQKIEYFLSVKG